MTPHPLKLLFTLLFTAAVALGQSRELLNTEATQLDTGAKRTTFRAAIGALEFLNVADYGAVSGGGDDTAAFESCFADGVTRGVKRVFIPAGEWHLADCDVPSGFHLFGAGAAGGTAWEATAVPAPVTRLFPTTSSATVLRFADIDGNVVENIDIEYVSASVTSTGYGILLQHGTPGTWPGAGFWFKNSTVRNFARGIYSNAANRIHVENSKLVQCDYGLYVEGATSSLSVVNSEMGGIPKDGGNGQAWYLSNTQGASFAGSEFGNCHRVGNIEGSSVVTLAGCNVETVSGPYGIGVTTGRLVLDAVSIASVTGPFVRNTGSQSGLVEFHGFTIRSGGSVIWDGRAVAYETSVDGDFPVVVNSPIACRRTTGDFSSVREYWSGDRNPLPFGSVPDIQRIALGEAYETASAASGAIYLSARGLSLRSWSTAGSTILTNLADTQDSFGGNLFAPVLSRQSDADVTTFDWSRRLVIRFTIQRIDQGSGSTSDNQAAVLFGVPYNRTTTGALADKGIGISISNISVSAVVHNGSAGQSAALGSLTDKSKKTIVLDYDGAGTLKASMTGHWDVTRSGGPTGEGTAHANSVIFAAWNTTGGTSMPHYSFSDLEIAYY